MLQKLFGKIITTITHKRAHRMDSDTQTNAIVSTKQEESKSIRFNYVAHAKCVGQTEHTHTHMNAGAAKSHKANQIK